MYAGGGGPTEPEETNHDKGATKAGEREASVFFDGGPGCVARFGTLEDAVVLEEDSAGNTRAYTHWEER